MVIFLVRRQKAMLFAEKTHLAVSATRKNACYLRSLLARGRQ